jgi:hypothetical protein
MTFFLALVFVALPALPKPPQCRFARAARMGRVIPLLKRRIWVGYATTSTGTAGMAITSSRVRSSPLRVVSRFSAAVGG